MFRDFLTRQEEQAEKGCRKRSRGRYRHEHTTLPCCPRGLFNDAISTQRACVLRFQDHDPLLARGRILVLPCRSTRQQ